MSVGALSKSAKTCCTKIVFSVVSAHPPLEFAINLMVCSPGVLKVYNG